MKTKNLLLGVALLFTGMLSAQEKGNFTAFVGDSYTFDPEVNTIGITFGGSYTFLDNMAIAPSFSYYFIDGREVLDLSYTELNLDARYYFVNKDQFNVFGLVGFAQRTSSEKGLGSVSREGFNIGAGASYKLNDHFGLLAQAKIIKVKDTDAIFVPFLGLQYTF